MERIGWLLVALLCCCSLRASVQAQPLSVTPAKSFLHRAILDRADVVVIASLDKPTVLPRRGLELASYDVQRSLLGDAQGRILEGGTSLAARAFKELPKILFLRGLKGESVYEYVDHVDLSEKDRESVVRTIDSYLALNHDDHPVRVAKARRAISMSGLQTTSEFCIRVAVHELKDLLDHASYALDGTEAKLLKPVLSRVPAEDQALATEVARRLQRMMGVDFSGTDREIPEGPLREHYAKLIDQYRQAKDPGQRKRMLVGFVESAGKYGRLFCEACTSDPDLELRLAAIRFLGEFQEAASVPVLTADWNTFGTTELLVRIEAVGKIASAESVALLKPFLSDAVLFDAAILAIARIGGPVAETILIQAERHLGSLPGSEERRAMVRSFQTDDWKRSEQKRRLAEFRVHQR